MKENSKNVDRYDFPVHDYTQEQKGSPYSISTFDNANGLSRKKEVTGARKNREHAVFFLVPITSKQATLA